MSAYYNEIDPFAAAWLRQLIEQGEIEPGVVDTRSVLEVRARDLDGFARCHFFAGIGGWPLALRLAGAEHVADLWTGSVPCEPLSSIGRLHGPADERHLWPAFLRLIAQRRPAMVVGEQVATRDGREWFAGIRLDLERAGYACGAADLPAAGVRAPHRRRRLFWVGHAHGARLEGYAGHGDARHQPGWLDALAARSAGASGLLDPWAAHDLALCEGDLVRRIEPESAPMVDGVPGRVGRLRGYGGAVVPQLAARFVQAALAACAH